VWWKINSCTIVDIMSARKKLIRQHFRNVVFTRDGYQCAFCDETQDLDAHHITDRTLMPNGGYVLENGITLCQAHHLLAEVWHTSEHREWADGLHPDDLYQIINSSYEEALCASESLTS